MESCFEVTSGETQIDEMKQVLKKKRKKEEKKKRGGKKMVLKSLLDLENPVLCLISSCGLSVSSHP